MGKGPSNQIEDEREPVWVCHIYAGVHACVCVSIYVYMAIALAVPVYLAGVSTFGTVAIKSRRASVPINAHTLCFNVCTDLSDDD